MTISEPPHTVQLIWQFKEISVHLCLLFPLPNPVGIQPCWGTSDTTGICVLFLPWYQGYQRNCCRARSPLWLYSPKELRSATRASEPGESLLLHPGKALNSFLQQFWELTSKEGSEFTFVVQCSCLNEPFKPQCPVKEEVLGPTGSCDTH